MKIREARESTNLSRAEMSRIFKIPIRTLEDWESGRRKAPEWAELLIIEKLETLKKGELKNDRK